MVEQQLANQSGVAAARNGSAAAFPSAINIRVTAMSAFLHHPTLARHFVRGIEEALFEPIDVRSLSAAMDYVSVSEIP